MIGLGVGVVAAVVAWLLDRRRRKYADRATTPAAALFAGLNEVKGRAWVARPISSHRTNTACVWWDYTLEEERRHTRTTTDSKGHTSTTTTTQWHQIEKLSDEVPEFEVVDDTGTATVRLAGAKVVPRQVHRDTFREEDNRGFFEKLLTSGNRTGRYRETERVVAQGDQLFVVGECELDEHRQIPLLTNKVMVSTRSEESHLTWLGVGVAITALIAVAALTIGIAMLISPDDPVRPEAVAPGLAVSLVLLAVAWAIATYNRLRMVAQGADRAWSLIDVQLRRRRDLIPALQSCVSAHAAHEQQVLVVATEARSGVGSQEATEAAALSDQAEAQTASLRTLFAVAEATPTLTADESFQRLQAELADTEDRIAGSRTFYNDSLTILRDRQQRFPGSLVAQRVPIAHRELIDARGFERTVPSVERAFSS